MRQYASALADRWGISKSDMATLLGYAPDDAKLAFIRLNDNRNRDFEDRIANLFVIHETISGLFDNPAREREVLRMNEEEFGGMSLLAIMFQGGLEDLIRVRSWLEYVAGR